VTTPTDAVDFDPRALSTARPFHALAAELEPRSALRAAIGADSRRAEAELLPALLEAARLPPAASEAASRLAHGLTERLRRHYAGGRAGLVQSLLQEFSLSSQEGVALMCLAEALLRVPDAATRDALVRDKISAGNWRSHLGHSASPFVNAAAWGLLLTGKLVATHDETGLSAALGRVIARGGEPLVRRGVDTAMRLLGERFVCGQSIDQALARARRLEAQGFRYSFDMLGEAALTDDDAHRYLAAYEQAIHAIGAASAGRGVYDGAGISVKLSALHPRYARTQRRRVLDEAYPRLRALALLARRYDIGLNIDAEEAERLELSLDLLERLCAEPGLAGWHGIGFVVQAYQKRCPAVIDYLIDLARRGGRRLMVRLVKGAYWDSEIKRAQVLGLDDYPVYTRKAHTDVCYLACARKLLAAPAEIYPQFATHNAHTLAAVYHLAGPEFRPGDYEFQCLHGMGEALYRQVVAKSEDGGLARPCRIYAPVGSHETLLPYLVRRLLENGANTSFVHRLADPSIPIETLAADPVAGVEALAAREGALGLPHPFIPPPRDLYHGARANSRGLDLSEPRDLEQLAAALSVGGGEEWRAAPMLADAAATAGEWWPVRNPADRDDVVGHVREARAEEVDSALRAAHDAAPAWAAVPPARRAAVLDEAAAAFERELPRLCGLLVREAGKTYANAVAEVREAVDFLRYYAAQVRADFAGGSHRPLGPVVCISPWNFPLAIFTGQIAAALAAGNVVLAKPAEQTPLIAAQAVALLRAAGVPAAALQLLPGSGEAVGAALVADARVRGVLFTGSTAVAKQLQRSLAGRLDEHGRSIPLVAETGGVNAMIVDSSALPEQVVNDVIVSAFDSAGQRCSALRLLCLQEDIADRVLSLLRGAMAQYRLGDPRRLDVDIGPLIDADARAAVEAHIQALRDKGYRTFQRALADESECRRGEFVAPTLIELDSVDELRREVFGPVLHVVRYRRDQLDRLLAEIAAGGYGLTMGVHSRIDQTLRRVTERARVGNLYANRNMIGAVVGVQPFGGEGLSGTGPKAGGPLYLYRLLAAWPAASFPRSLQRLAPDLDSDERERLLAPLRALQAWADSHGQAALAELCAGYAALTPAGTRRELPGPTGERNLYALYPRERVLCLADLAADLLNQLAAVLAVGGCALWLDHAPLRALYERLPEVVRARIALIHDWRDSPVAFDVLLHHGADESFAAACRQVARRDGAIVTTVGLAPGETRIPLEPLLLERAVSINTAAAGGNARLMMID